LGSYNAQSRLGTGYLSAVLRKAGHEVYQYNADYEDEKAFANQKELFDESLNFIESVNDPGHRVYKDVFAHIKAFNPDIVGLTAMAGTISQCEIIAMYCHSRGIKTIIGGTMVTLALAEMMKYPFYDQLVPGEAERVIVQTINHPERRIIVGMNVANLDTLPFPDRDNYITGNDKLVHDSVATARGCSFKCKYCVNSLLGGEVRARSPKNVVLEMQHIIETYHQHKFRFFDDTFTVNKPKVMEFIDRVTVMGHPIEFLIETRVDCLDAEMLKGLKAIGLKTVKLGIESGSERILKIYKPQYQKDDIRSIVQTVKDLDIGVSLNWMFGFPEETDDDLKESIAFAKELDADWNTISSLAPYYGTDLFDQLPEDQKKHWRGFYHTMKKPVMNEKLSQELIDEFLAVNNDA
jgi:radical SAM superfamily enzyme YgiQ (UPF0313 family)